MRTRFKKADDRFEVDHGHLVRTVTGADGRSYVHRCTQDVYVAVAHAMQSAGEDGATVDTLVAALDMPYTQMNVALEFLKERGCVYVHLRRSYPASTFAFEDGMLEYFALGQEQ